jgi:hypothetical protein
MSTHEDRDLASAFEDLTAPASTANYATRTPSLEIRTARSHWPQALATTLAVLVAVAGAGTFLALRNARQGGVPAGSTGTPPARLNAVMAYDSTAGVTVMFGGVNASGKALTDTWSWNGSTWTAQGHGPGSLVGLRMVDDPSDGGLLLIAAPQPALNGGSSGSGAGCVVGSATGSASGGGVSTGSPPAPATLPPGRNLVRPTGPPINDPLPTAVGSPLAAAVASPPASTCQPVAASPPAQSEQTWLFHAGGWSRVASGSSAVAPPDGAQMAFDPTTHQVVAVSSTGFNCGPPLAVPADSAIACPLVGSGTRTLAPESVPGAPCGVLLGCLTNSTISTWTWSGGSWTKAPANTALQRSGVTLLFDDPATNHVTLMTQFNVGLYGGNYQCPAPAPGAVAPAICPAPLPLVTTWTWTGSGWRQVSQLQNIQQAPSFAGANVAAIGGHILVLTSDGQTWTWAAGLWTQDTVFNHPAARTGATISEGPAGSVVLFGGTSGLGVAAMPGAVGSDTWTWDGASWRHVGGTQPSAPPVSSCPPLPNGSVPSCVQPQPAQVSPNAAAPLVPTLIP